MKQDLRYLYQYECDKDVPTPHGAAVARFNSLVSGKDVQWWECGCGNQVCSLDNEETLYCPSCRDFVSTGETDGRS